MTDLPASNVLAAIGSAIVVSVICTWTINTHFHAQTQREMDRLHSRLDALTSGYACGRSVGSPEPVMSDNWEMEDGPAMPAKADG